MQKTNLASTNSRKLTINIEIENFNNTAEMLIAYLEEMMKSFDSECRITIVEEMTLKTSVNITRSH